ncbi:MAG: hypothetical protein M3044_21785 [Thermoproteota archaeon]|nr:hypothetical protein [Thermoproteota archaeon]
MKDQPLLTSQGNRDLDPQGYNLLKVDILSSARITVGSDIEAKNVEIDP